MVGTDIEGNLWLLVDGDDRPVRQGSDITDFRGEVSVFESAEIPRHSGSTGRVNNKYPSVFGLSWRQLA